METVYLNYTLDDVKEAVSKFMGININEEIFQTCWKIMKPSQWAAAMVAQKFLVDKENAVHASEFIVPEKRTRFNNGHCLQCGKEVNIYEESEESNRKGLCSQCLLTAQPYNYIYHNH